MAVRRTALVVLLVILCSVGFDCPCSISPVAAATEFTQGPTFMSLYVQKKQVLSSLRSAGYHRVAAFLELSNVLRALPQNATLFAPSDEAISTIVFSPKFSTLLLYHFAARRFSFPDLLVLPQGTRIGTFLPGRSLLVTSARGATKVSIDGVAVVAPDIYQDGTLCVHGVTATLDPDRFGMAEDLSPVLTAPARNTSSILAPARNPENSDPANVGLQRPSSSVGGPVTRPSPAGSQQQIITLPPVSAEVRSGSMLAPAAAIYIDQGPRTVAHSPGYHVGAPFSPASSNHLDSGHASRSSHRGRRTSKQLTGENHSQGGPVASGDQDLASRGQGPAASAPAVNFAPRRAHGPSQHHRLSSSTPSNSRVSSSRISSSPSPDPYHRSSRYRGTGPSPHNASRQDSSRHDFAGASPLSAPSPHSGRLSSPYSPSGRVPTPPPHTYRGGQDSSRHDFAGASPSSAPSPHNLRLSSPYSPSSRVPGRPPSPHTYGGGQDSSRHDFAGASPSSAPSPHSGRLSSPHSPSSRVPGPSPHTYGGGQDSSRHDFAGASPSTAPSPHSGRLSSPYSPGPSSRVPGPSPHTYGGGQDSSRHDFAGASPSSAPSPHSGRLSSPYSPSSRVLAPSPHNYVVANLVASDQTSNSPYGSSRPVNAGDRTWVSPSSPSTAAQGPAGRLPFPPRPPSISSPSAHNSNFTSTSPGFANATDSMRPATPFLPSFSPVTPPSRAPATGRPLLSSSPPARIGPPPAPSNANLEGTSPPSVYNLRDPVA